MPKKTNFVAGKNQLPSQPKQNQQKKSKSKSTSSESSDSDDSSIDAEDLIVIGKKTQTQPASNSNTVQPLKILDPEQEFKQKKAAQQQNSQKQPLKEF